MEPLGDALLDMLKGVLTPEELAAALDAAAAQKARNLWWEQHRPQPMLDGKPFTPRQTALRDPAEWPTEAPPYGPPADAPFDGTELSHHGPYYRCPLCRDAGFVRRDVQVSHPDFGTAVPCRCLVENDATRASRHALRVKRSGLPPEMARMTLERFEHVEGTAVALNAIQAVLDAHRTNAERPRWCAIFGSPGTGKSHLLAAATQVLGAQTDVAWAKLPDFLAECKAHRPDPHTGELREFALDTMLTERAKTIAVLVMDRIGGQAEGAWGTEKLETILDYRYERRLVTLLGFEVSPGELGRWSPRIASRLDDRGICTTAGLTCDDYRQRPPRGETA